MLRMRRLKMSAIKDVVVHVVVARWCMRVALEARNSNQCSVKGSLIGHGDGHISEIGDTLGATNVLVHDYGIIWPEYSSNRALKEKG